MKKVNANGQRVLIILLSLILGSILLGGSVTLAEEPMAVPGEIIVKVSAGLNLDSLLLEVNAVIWDSVNSQNIYLIKVYDTATVDDIIADLKENSLVEFAEPNYIMVLPESFQMSISFPDESRPPTHAGISPPMYYGQPAIYSIGFDTAHTITKGAGVTVAIIDNGLAMAHPLMAGYISPNVYDFYDNDAIPEEDSGAVYGHGTFVAGLIRLGAPEATIMPLRAFNGDGVGDVFAIISAVNWAMAYDVDVINMSFGAHVNSEALSYMIAESIDSSITVVAAAGNYGSSERVYPAAYDGVIAVSAIDSLELLANFSSYGTDIDICAPGVNLYSSLAGEYEWGTWSGTSFSAALVSATSAITLSLMPAITAIQMEIHLRNTARKALLWGTITPPDSLYGYGVVNAAGAVGINGTLLTGSAMNINTITTIMAYLFEGAKLPVETVAGFDINGDRKVNIADIDKAVSQLFGNNHIPDKKIK